MNSRFLCRPVLVVWVILSLLVTAGCEGESQSQNVNTPPPAKTYTGTIVALGDSLTAGMGVDEDKAYPAQLERKLQTAGHNYKVINSGVSGETTSGTLSRLDWALTLDPDIVILEIGANDGLRGIDPAIPETNLQKIVQRLKQEQIIVVFCGMQMVWNLGPEYTSQFNSIYPRIAAEEQLIFMEFFLEDVAMVRELNNDDGLHPNSEGYAIVVDNLYPFVEEAISLFEKQSGL